MSLPPREIIDEWKAKYGKVYSSSIRGEDYVFRALTYNEYTASEALEDISYAEEQVVFSALLHPSDIDVDNTPAGVFSSLCNDILDASGFGNAKSAKALLEEGREKVEEVWGIMKTMVIAAIPSYKDEELNDLSFEEMAYKVALAEAIFRLNQQAFAGDGNISIEITDPEEEEKKIRAQQQHKSEKERGLGHAPPDDPIAQQLRDAMGG